MFLMWFDDSRTTPTERKIADACEAYRERFGHAPALVLVNTAEVVGVPGVEVRGVAHVRRSNYWAGREDY